MIDLFYNYKLLYEAFDHKVRHIHKVEKNKMLFVQKYLTASSKCFATPFLRFDGLTQIALIPQEARVAFSSHTIDPFMFESIASEVLRVEHLLKASLRKHIPPNCNVFCIGFSSFPLAPSVLICTGSKRTLCAILIDSTKTHPETLCEDMYKYTCNGY